MANILGLNQRSPGKKRALQNHGFPAGGTVLHKPSLETGNGRTLVHATIHALLAVITNTEKGFLRDPVEALWKNCMKLTLQRLEFLPLSEIT